MDTSVLVTSSCFCANYFRLALWWISISFPHLYSFSPFFLSLICFLRRLIMRLFFLSLPFLSQCTNAISFILNSLERIKFVQYLSNLQLSNIHLSQKTRANKYWSFFFKYSIVSFFKKGELEEMFFFLKLSNISIFLLLFFCSQEFSSKQQRRFVWLTAAPPPTNPAYSHSRWKYWFCHYYHSYCYYCHPFKTHSKISYEKYYHIIIPTHNKPCIFPFRVKNA